jgi:hypothetical protein
MNQYDSMGFVTVDEITNVFTEAMRELEAKIFPSCPSVERRSDQAYLMTFFDDIRLKLQSRARENLQSYLENAPQVKQAAREEKAAGQKDKSRLAYEDRIKTGRARFDDAYR